MTDQRGDIDLKELARELRTGILSMVCKMDEINSIGRGKADLKDIGRWLGKFKLMDERLETLRLQLERQQKEMEEL